MKMQIIPQNNELYENVEDFTIIKASSPEEDIITIIFLSQTQAKCGKFLRIQKYIIFLHIPTIAQEVITNN